MTEKTDLPVKKKEEKSEMTRRNFIEKAAVGAAAFTILPRHVLGRGFTPPSDLLNIACVGVGGMGRSNMINLASQNIVAICDVDWDYTDKNLARLDTDASNLKGHIDHPGETGATMSPERSRKSQGTAGGDSPPEERHVAQSQALFRLSQNVGTAKGHRRRRRRHSRSHAHAHRSRRHGSSQARLRAKAALLVRRRSPPTFQARRRNKGSHTNGQPGPFAGCRTHRSRICLGRRDWRSP